MSQPQNNGSLSQAMSAKEVVGQVKLIQEVMRDVMTDGEHYGVVPGSKKKSLWKSGAEKLCLVFRLAPRFKSTETYDGKHLTVKSECILIHSPTGREIGSGEAICTTKEKKYYWRKDGGKMVENQELPDLYNTIIKMANKRALVAATLVSTAASDIFTQDMGDDIYVVDDEPKKVDATVKDSPKEQPATEGKKETKAIQPPLPADVSRWVGTIDSIQAQELSDKTPCWEIRGNDGTTLKTKEKDCYELAAEALAGDHPVEIQYKLSAKGNRVIDKLRVEALT